jgi:hypothetical protein
MKLIGEQGGVTTSPGGTDAAPLARVIQALSKKSANTLAA